MNLFQSNRRSLIFVGIGAVAGAAALFFFAPSLIGYFLVAALLVGVVWIGSHYAVTWFRRRKQRRFDAGLAAREGIEDRRREWTSWTAELEQQGIDRYDLPFFLLVGEPQSGKSVLLQNSDLTFPFGQTRLSGIGGTRGCDWWFTEEAVILDLAGRLFTHEGGASDEAEWEAFLRLLADYRPVCPANGLMLVIPCDSLLRDSRDEAARKASKIQNALLTLTNELQAQLPIYVVLTKADRIFGFAETVHRLDAEQRQQMFGWSRSAEDYEAPFDIVEVRRAFEGVVERARQLRETMMSTVRLPEGIGEVDRLYAFPDELGAIGPSLEIYLKRIFSESRLVDRLYFRGFYVTSGLQTGTPIANVCAELYGGATEADQRDLSALFTKQHAYFIKDLIRRRVFSERGLVRPTQARVARARRNAWISYGAASLLAVISVIWSIIYVLGEYQQGELQKFRNALRTSAAVANANAPEFDQVLTALDSVWAAQQVAPRSLESAGISRTDSFEELFHELFDERFAPALRRLATEALAEQSGEAPADFATFRHRAEQVRLLLAGFDPGDAETVATFSDLFEEQSRGRIAEAVRRRAALAGEKPVPLSERPGGPGTAPAGDLATVAQWIDGLWERVLVGGDPIQIRGPAGYLVAWHDLDAAHAALADLDPGDFEVPDLQRRVAAYHGAASYLDAAESKAELPPDGSAWLLPRARVDDQLETLATERERFHMALRGTPLGSWRELELLSAFGERVFGPRRAATDLDEAVAGLDGPTITVPTQQLEGWLAPPLLEATAPDALATGATPVSRDLPTRLRRARTSAARDADGLAQRIVQARCRILQNAYLAHVPDWPALQAALAAPDADGLRDTLVPGLEHLTGTAREVEQLAPEHPEWFKPWTTALTEMLGTALEAARPAVRDWWKDAEPTVDPALLTALNHVGETAPRFADRAEQLRAAHVVAVHGGLMERWSAAEPTPANTTAMLRTLATHLERLRETLADPELTRTTDTWLESEVRSELQRRLDAHLALVARASPIPLPSSDLLRAAGDIEQLLKPTRLNRWQDELTKDWKAFDAAEVATSLESLGTWPPITEVVTRLRRCATREPEFATYLARGSRADVLQRGAEMILNLPDADTGPALAGVLSALRTDRPDTPAESVADWMLDQLLDALDTVATTRLRALYAEKLRERFDFRDSLELALYPEPEDLPRLADRGGEIASDLEDFLGANGELVQLRDAYLLDAEFEFRPPADAAESDPVWAFDRFLSDLRRLILAGADAESLAEHGLEIRLVPHDLDAGVWTFNYLFTNVQAGDDNFVDTATLDSRSQIGPLEWHFGADGSDELWFRWTRSASGNEQPDDVELRIGSCVAPLALVWTFGTPAGSGGSADTWRIAAPTRGEGELQARFDLRFERPVPQRPEFPWGR